MAVASPVAPTLPRGPRGSFLVGQMPALGTEALGFFTVCAREYGDFVPLRLGPTRAVLLSHPDLVEEVLVARNHDFRKNDGARRLSSLLGNGLVLSEGDFWRRQRRLAQPAFHRQRIAGYGETMVTYAERMLAGWRDGETRDVHREMVEVTFQIAARTLFGTEVAGDVARLRGATLATTQHFRSRLFTLLFFLPDSVPTPGNLRFRRAVRELDLLVYRIIQDRRATGEDPGDLLSMLLRAQDENGSGMTDRQLRDEVLTLLLAGHDTTALALSWAWYLLARNPEAEARLWAELDEVLDGRPPTVADVPRLRYAEAVISESMRLYPPAWTMGRKALRDTTVGGYPVRRGTTLLMSQWVIHRDPRFFEEPDRFQPERWVDGTLARKLPRFAYFPFGGGQRICIGNTFAMLEAVLLLASIAQRYRLTLVDPDQPVTPLPVITLRPNGGVAMRLQSRSGREFPRAFTEGFRIDTSRT
jgi:cytochrome P450